MCLFDNSLLFPPLQILYDDDDTWDGVSRSDILTVQMFRDQNGRYAPPLIERESDALTPRMTLEELYEVKCGACVNCEKEDCGRCASCVSNGDSNRRQACLQKVSNIRWGVKMDTSWRFLHCFNPAPI